MILEFRSYCGHQPWFFVPDTGIPGGAAVLTRPDGSTMDCVNTQVDPTVWDWPALGEGFTAPRMGFEVPGIFTDYGIHTLTVTQDDADGNPVVDTYTITVVLDIDELLNHGALGELSRLNQLREAYGRPAFSLAPDVSAEGFDEVELAALNTARYLRGVQTIVREA